MNEALVRKCLKIYKKREDAYYEAARKFKAQDMCYQYNYCMSAAMAYNSAATMLEYAINGDAECLYQFDS